jgi:hypothetical protein
MPTATSALFTGSYLFIKGLFRDDFHLLINTIHSKDKQSVDKLPTRLEWLYVRALQFDLLLV